MKINRLNIESFIIENNIEKKSAYKVKPRKSGYPTGSSEYGDPSEGKYPLDSEEHILAAKRYIGMPRNRKALGDKLESTEKRIDAAYNKGKKE